MREEMRAYFRGEQRESLLAILLSLAALALAWRAWPSPYRWAVVPLALLGLVQAVGAALHWRGAGRQRERVAVLLAEDPGRYQTQELARGQKAMAALRYSLGFDVLVLGAGVVLLVALRDVPTWLGVGGALAGYGAVLLLLDLWSASRLAAYLAHVRRFLTAAGARPTTPELGDVAHE